MRTQLGVEKSHDWCYLDLLESIMQEGEVRSDRTGVGTISLFGWQLAFDLADNVLPVLTTKRINFHAVAEEKLWMLRGHTNVKQLNERGVKIWDEWAGKDGDLGPIYGTQWREWKHVDDRDYGPGFDPSGRPVYHDQVAEALRLVREDPYSRRIVVSAWNVGLLGEMRLPPCHIMHQLSVRHPNRVSRIANAGHPEGFSLNDLDERRLDMHMVMRSTDAFLGLPFNIAGYSLLLCLYARATGLKPGRLVVSLGDVHVYLNHLEQVKTQLARQPKPSPRLVLTPHDDRPREPWEWDWSKDKWDLEGYDPHPFIAAPVAV